MNTPEENQPLNDSPSRVHRSGIELWKLAHRRIKILNALNFTHLHHADTEIMSNGLSLRLIDFKSLGSLFHPMKGFSSIWNLLISFVLFYSCIISPALLVFESSPPNSIPYKIDIATDLLMFCDLCIKFNTSYYNQEKTLSKSRKEVVIHYLTTWFIYDLASCFPYELVSLGSGIEKTQSHVVNVALRLVRGRRMWMVSRVLRLFKFMKCFTKGLKLMTMGMSHNVVKLFETLIKLAAAIHIFACFILIATEIDGNTPDSWITRFGIQDSDNKYLYAVYFILTTLSTVGYGDITPRTSLEIVITITWMFIAIYFLSFNISSISSLTAEANYKKRALAQKMNLIESFSRREGIERNTQNKMKNEINEKLSRLTHTAEDRQKLLSFLPIDLKYEIAQKMHQCVIKIIPFFEGKQKDFIGNIFPLLHQKHLIDKEIIFLQNQQAKEVYFIVEGKISLIYGNDNNPFRYLTVGCYFGDYEVTHSLKRVYGTISKRTSSLLVMGKDLVSKFRQDFHGIWNEFKEEAKFRHEVNIKAISEMIVIKKINSEGLIKKVSKRTVKELIQQQAGILTHKSLDFSLEEIREREVVGLKRKILEQREAMIKIEKSVTKLQQKRDRYFDEYYE